MRFLYATEFIYFWPFNKLWIVSLSRTKKGNRRFIAPMTFMRLSGFQVQGEKESVISTNQSESGVNKSAGESSLSFPKA